MNLSKIKFLLIFYVILVHLLTYELWSALFQNLQDIYVNILTILADTYIDNHFVH